MSDLRERLERLRPPDAEEARRRGLEVARAAYEERGPRRRRPWRPAVLAALVAAGVATGLSPAGAALGEWVRDVVRAEPAPRPPLARMPGDASVLAVAGEDLWIVRPDASRRRLGTYEDAGFSPQARFVVATRGTRLVALDPAGRVRWALDRAGGVADPRWAPSGLRVAYRAGGSVRVVYGDGNLDRRLASRVARVAPAWRPGPSHVLAWVDRAGRVETWDTDAGRRLWRSRPLERPQSLAWSPDGRALLVAGTSAVARLDADGRLVRTIRLPGVQPETAWLPGGEAFVTIASEAGRSSVVRHDRGDRRLLFSGPGPVDGVAPSPDGRWVLVGWAGADQWLFVRADGRGRPRSAAAIARDFTPDAARPPFPRPLGWR